MIRLGVNIDHVATIRQARRGRVPDPVAAAALAEIAGADAITVHLREDRRHIQERDVRVLRETVQTRLNLEAAVDPAVVALAVALRPHQVTFVPERREELTTEGGLDVISVRERLAEAIGRCHDAGIEVSLFIDPSERQVEMSAELGADAVELHTGAYADAADEARRHDELEALRRAGMLTIERGMLLHAGHGLDYWNVDPIAEIPGMRELNIGFSIVARAVLVGMERAVRDMKDALRRAERRG